MTAATIDSPPSPAPLEYVPAAPSPLANQKTFRFPWHLLLLLGITALGALLRFSYPAKPPLWGDDAYTVYRTHADYQSMLDILQFDGFTPLHYELYWLLGRAAGTENSPIVHARNSVSDPDVPRGPRGPGRSEAPFVFDEHGNGPKVVHSIGMTPQVVRLLPAFFGTVMVPAMYFLAVQLVRRRTALVVALVTACSAYVLGYSRDMKMYMMVWCFSALSAGSLLWWFRTGTRIAWLAWVASSLAMASSHMTGMALLPFELIFFLTRSKVHWKDSILYVIGLAIAVAPPASYMIFFNTWVQDSVEDFGFEVEGLGWIGPYNAGRSGPALVRYSASAYLLSWEWPKPINASERPAADPSTDKGVPQWIMTALKSATALFILLAVAGAMPWSRRLRGIKEDEPPPPQPWWRVVLWLGLWLILPIYAIYCRSVTDFASPKDWWKDIGEFFAVSSWIDPQTHEVSVWFWYFVAFASAIVATLVFLLPRFRRVIVWLFPLLAGAGLAICLLEMGLPGKLPKSETQTGLEWVGTLARPIGEWTDWMSNSRVLLALLIVLPGLALFYCGSDWKLRTKRAIQFVLVVFALIAAAWGVNKFIENKFNKELAQILNSSASDMTASDVLKNASPSQIESAKTRISRQGGPWASIFMPRYVGFVWIAFCIALCALLMRLPTRGLRIVAVVLLVGVNLAQFSGRVFAGTEPPLDRVAKDLWARDPSNPKADHATRVYVNDSAVGSSGHPGWGTLNGQQGKYYLGLERGYWIHPKEWKAISASQYFDLGSRSTARSRQGIPDYTSVARDLRSYPDTNRIIIWEKYFDETTDRKDRLSSLLGPGWKVASEEDFHVRFHWNWADLYVYRRSEYVKTPVAAAVANTAAGTAP